MEIISNELNRTLLFYLVIRLNISPTILVLTDSQGQ
jgi:hypothetical protein